MEQSKTTDASGGGELSVLRQAARAGRLRVRRNERLSDADPDAGMVWPIEVELPCINGLSCWFSLGSVYAPDAAAQGYTDGALNDDLAQAFAHYIVAALASAPPAPTPEAGSDLAGQGEPVAWAYEWNEGEFDIWHLIVSQHKPAEGGQIRNIRPLFAAPAPSRPADREEIARWRNDAFEKAAAIVRRYEPFADDAVRDILALRDAPRDGGGGWRPTREQIARAGFNGWYGSPAYDDFPEVEGMWLRTADSILSLFPPSANAGDGTQDRQGGGR